MNTMFKRSLLVQIILHSTIERMCTNDHLQHHCKI